MAAFYGHYDAAAYEWWQQEQAAAAAAGFYQQEQTWDGYGNELMPQPSTTAGYMRSQSPGMTAGGIPTDQQAVDSVYWEERQRLLDIQHAEM